MPAINIGTRIRVVWRNDDNMDAIITSLISVNTFFSVDRVLDGKSCLINKFNVGMIVIEKESVFSVATFECLRCGARHVMQLGRPSKKVQDK
jgi:hypothetical protein